MISRNVFAFTMVLFVAKCVIGQTNHNFVHNGINRTFTVFRPAGTPQGAKLPLLLSLHGFTQSGPQMMNYSQFNNLAAEQQFMVVYPNGINTSWNVGQGGNSGADDVGFLLALIDTLDQWYGVNQSRVYACGFSNGGFMSYRLACEASDRIAAIASVAGTMTVNTFNNCAPQRPVPVMHIHGTNDFLVGYNGSSGFMSVMEGINFWTTFNQCPSEPQIVNLPDVVPEGSTVQQLTWAPCAQNTMVRHLKVNNGGHTWPGFNGLMGIGNVNMDISASVEIWNFVSQFSIEQAVFLHSPTDVGFRIYPNPTRDGTIQLEAPGFRQSEIRIMGLDGILHYRNMINGAQNTIQISVPNLSPGVYQIILTDVSGNVQSKLFVRL